MKSFHLVFVAPLLALTAVACGGTIQTTTTTGGFGGATSGTSGTTSSAASTGAGSEAATSSSSAGSGGSGSACSGFIDVTAAGEAVQHFATACAGSWGSSENQTAIGYHFSGGAAPGADELDIGGCAGPGANAAGLYLSTPKVAATGTFLDGSASYTDAKGMTWSTGLDPYSLVITRLDQPGGVIEGTFSGSVAGPTDAKKSLTATFHVCRVSDLNAP